MSAQPGTRAGGNPAATPSQMAIMSAQPGTRAGGIASATASTSMDLLTENHIRNMVKHRVSMAHVPALAVTDDEMDGEEEVRSQASRGATRTSGKLRSATTSVVHKVSKSMYTPYGVPQNQHTPWLSYLHLRSPSTPSPIISSPTRPCINLFSPPLLTSAPHQSSSSLLCGQHACPGFSNLTLSSCSEPRLHFVKPRLTIMVNLGSLSVQSFSDTPCK